ncbi:MAG: hypothetical protein ACLFNQ_11175 [Spirochaetaceae bacterium]
MKAIHRRVAVGILIAMLSACASTGPVLDEISAPVYSALRSDALLANRESAVIWRPSAGGGEDRFTTFGPDGPHVFLSDLLVMVVEFDVEPGPETRVVPHSLYFDLDRDRVIRRRVAIDPVSINRSLTGPQDLTSSDLSGLIRAIRDAEDLSIVETLTARSQVGEYYQQYQLLIPDHAIYLYLEADRVRNSDTMHSLAIDFPDIDNMADAVIDQDILVAFNAAIGRDIATREPASRDPVRSAAAEITVGDVETDEAGVATVDVPGGVYTGPVVDGRPDGEGRIEYDDGRTYEGGFREGRFNGRAVLRGPEGDELELTFNNGVPEGAGEYRFGQEAYSVSYSEGARTDARYLERIVPNYREIQRQRDELTAAIREGLPESAFADNAEAIEGLRAQLDGDTGPERLLFQFDIDDQLIEFRVNDDGLVVSRFEEIRVEDDDGELLAVYRAGDRLAVTDQGAALRISREQIERLEEPRETVSFRTLVGGGGAFFGRSVQRGGANFGLDFRSMNNSGEPLPGLSGGDGGGWDWRAAARTTADFQRIRYDLGEVEETETEFRLSVSGAGGIGRTRYSFDPANRETLEQEGRGRTFGLQLLFNYELVRPEPPPPPDGLETLPGGELILSAYETLTRRGRLFPAPFFSVETYRYSPGSVQLESRVTEFQLLLGGGIGLFVTTTLNSF